MAKVYTEEELNNFSRETLMAVILSMQDQIHQLNTNMERLIEQIADANTKRYGRSSEKLETISGQLEKRQRLRLAYSYRTSSSGWIKFIKSAN